MTALASTTDVLFICVTNSVRVFRDIMTKAHNANESFIYLFPLFQKTFGVNNCVCSTFFPLALTFRLPPPVAKTCNFWPEGHFRLQQLVWPEQDRPKCEIMSAPRNKSQVWTMGVNGQILQIPCSLVKQFWGIFYPLSSRCSAGLNPSIPQDHSSHLLWTTPALWLPPLSASLPHSPTNAPQGHLSNQ